MSILMNGFHPSFEALSALADQGELEASRTRVGRHVSRCAECRGVVADIRSYGDAVRETEAPAMPDGLWARIQGGLQSAAPGGGDQHGSDRPQQGDGADRAPRGTPSPDDDAWRAAPALRPTTHVPSPIRRGMRRGAILLAAAAVIVGVLLVPTSKGDRLQASPTTGTWRFSPARPAPGATVTVRFEPPASMKPAPSFMLLGTPAPAAPWVGEPRAMSWGGLQDSLGMLTRQPDGAYSGRFVVPAGFTAMLLRLGDVSGSRPRRIIMSPDGPVNRDREPVAMLVGGDSRGEPSLASLTAALELWSGQPSDPYAVADTLIRYFPSEPIGYAADRRVGSHRLIDDLIAYFKRGERQYVKFDQRYMARPSVSAEHEMAMIEFAQRIDEPAEVRKWTMRLAREHADDPRALYFYGTMLTRMLGRPNTVDSVRAALPLADTLWERNGHRMVDIEIVRAASTVEDTAAYRRWAVRAFSGELRGFRGDYIGLDSDLLDDPGIRAVAVPRLRQQVAASCEVPAGKVSFWMGNMAWRYNCQMRRAMTFNTLSRAARLDGHPREALALADSSLAVSAAYHVCGTTGGHRRRGEALLALHDTAAAVPELAKGIGYLNWRALQRQDSLAARLRGVISRAQLDSLVRKGNDEQVACAAEASRRERAERMKEIEADRAAR